MQLYLREHGVRNNDGGALTGVVLLASDKRDCIHRCVPVRTYHISEQRSVDTDDSGDRVSDEQPAELLQPDVP